MCKGRRIVRGMTEQTERATLGPFQCRQKTQERGLARPVGAQQRDPLTPGNRNAHMIQCRPIQRAISPDDVPRIDREVFSRMLMIEAVR